MKLNILVGFALREARSRPDVYMADRLTDLDNRWSDDVHMKSGENIQKMHRLICLLR